MNDVLHANIFFFITSVAVLLITFLVAWALYYIVAILKNIRDISNRVDRSSEELVGDLRELRQNIREKGMTISYVFAIFQNLVKRMVTAPKAPSRRPAAKRSSATTSAATSAAQTSADDSVSKTVSDDSESTADASE